VAAAAAAERHDDEDHQRAMLAEERRRVAEAEARLERTAAERDEVLAQVDLLRAKFDEMERRCADSVARQSKPKLASVALQVGGHADALHPKHKWYDLKQSCVKARHLMKDLQAELQGTCYRVASPRAKLHPFEVSPTSAGRHCSDKTENSPRPSSKKCLQPTVAGRDPGATDIKRQMDHLHQWLSDIEDKLDSLKHEVQESSVHEVAPPHDSEPEEKDVQLFHSVRELLAECNELIIQCREGSTGACPCK